MALVAALALVVTARATDPKRRPRASGLAGAAWGTLALLRTIALLVGPLGVAWLLFTFRSKHGIRRALGFLAGFRAGDCSRQRDEFPGFPAARADPDDLAGWSEFLYRQRTVCEWGL